ncbi:alpha/beta fold hydrolase [Niveispirillum sp. KHB5.9]|uniref:S9 family peptidase n=1 Tax=Niveispirillum sp. KHB5.9 TaxID=3400269 RepID=UPI003A8A452A
MQCARAEDPGSPAAILSLPGPGLLSLSPDGLRVARVPVADAPVLHFLDTQDVQGAPVSISLPVRVQAMTWAQDGQRLFLRATEASGGGERTYVADVATRSVTDLTPDLPGRVRLVSGTPDGDGAYLVMHTPQQGAAVRLVRIDGKGVRPAVDITPPGNYGWFVADDQGLPAVALQIGGGSKMQWIALTPAGQPGSVLVDAGTAGTNEPVSLMRTAAGRRIAIFRTAQPQQDYPGLTGFDLDGAGATVILTPDHDVTAPLFARQEPELLAYVRERLVPERTVVDPAMAGTMAGLAVDGGFAEIAARARNGLWLVKRRYADRPAAYLLYRPDNGQWSPPLAEMPGPPMPARQVADWVTARDGLRLPVYLTLPDRPGAAPLVVLIHGGPWRRDRFDYDRTLHWLAARGYAVLRVNFRGSTGFGAAFTRAGDGEWSGAMLADILDATRWALRQPGVDQGPPAFVGGSYGGFAALMLASQDEVPARCTIAIAAAVDLGSFAPRYAAAERSSKAQLKKALGDFDDASVRDHLTTISPITRLDKVAAPVLLIHGGRDPRAPLDDVKRYADALYSRKPQLVSFAVAPEEGHSFSDPKAMLAAVGLQDRFLGRCFGRALPAATEEDPAPLRMIHAGAGA